MFIIVLLSGDLRKRPVFAVLSLCKSELDPIFKELELLKLSDIRQLELGKLMFSLNNSLLPSKFNNHFSLNKQVHSYATRHANVFTFLFVEQTSKLYRK